MLRDVLVRFDNLWQMPFPYVMALHQAPTDGDDYRGFHFHIEFHPPLRKPNLLKYLAGPEIGGGNFLSDTSPGGEGGRAAAAGGPHYGSRARASDAMLRLRRSLLAPRSRSCTADPRRRGRAPASSAAIEALARVADDDEGDTIYAVDRVSEDVLVERRPRGLRRVRRRSC